MVEALVFIRVGTSESLSLLKCVTDELVKIEEVEEVYDVFGRYDLVVRLKVNTLDDLSNLIADEIRYIPGVLSTETLIVRLKTGKK